MALSAAQAAKQAEILATIDAVATGLRGDIKALKDAIAAGGGEDPAVTTAFNAIAARLAPLVALDAETPGGSVQPVDPPDGL